MTERFIVIGDVHGCYDELCRLLEKAHYSQGKDRLVFVGDLVDRGPEPIKVIKLLQSLKAECTLGNHDERLIRYRKHLRRHEEDNRYHIPMKAPDGATYEKLDKDDWDWLESLPTSIRLTDRWGVIHAGLEPGVAFQDQKSDVLLHTRYIFKSSGKPVRHLDISDVAAKEVCIWPEAWDGHENVIYGHMVTPTKLPHITISALGALCVGIDTGCCFGYSLTAMVMDSDGKSFSFVSVEAGKPYDPDFQSYSECVTPV